MKIPLLSKFGSKVYNGLFKLKLRIEILQTIQFNKTDKIKSNSQWKNILKLQYRFKIHNTQLNRRLSTRNYFGLKVQFLYQNLQNIEIWKSFWPRFSKLIWWLITRTHEWYFRIPKPYSLWINSQFGTGDPNDKIWHKNIEKHSIEFFFKWT